MIPQYSSRAIKTLTTLLVCSVALAGCSSAVSGTDKLVGNELKYGASPQQSSSITYQPDVVFVGGADSIKSVSADGLLWTISGSAPNVQEVRPGKILFASSLGVGRVLAATQRGADKQILLGPVAITDVVRDGTFSSSAPIPLTSVEAYTVPDQPGLLTETTDIKTPTSGGVASPNHAGSNSVILPPVHLVAYEPGQHPLPTPSGQPFLTTTPGTLPAPSPSPSPSPSSVGNYKTAPFCCSNGLGVGITYDNNGLQLNAKVTLHLNRPTVSFKLGIASGKLNAAVELHGAGGISVGLDARSTSGLEGNVANQRVQIPVEFSFPVQAGPLPLMIDFDQVFGMDIAFTAKNSVFAATGAYKFGGTLGFGVVNGSWTVYKPQDFAVTKALTDHEVLESVGPASIVIAYAAKFSVGIGLAFLHTGPWYELTFAAGVTNTGPTSEFQCKQVSLAISSQYGVGYRIPKPVANAINAVLGVFNVKPIQAAGGLVGPSITAIKKSSTFPPIAASA